MTTVKHTAGPWHLVASDNWTLHIQHEHGNDWTDINDLDSRVCVMPAEIMQSYNALANGRLMSAAPDLLAALQDMLSGWQYIRKVHGDLHGVGWDRAQSSAAAAIDKATKP